ncbi:MAG: Riboflavin synthase [Pelotomaculum sp. PtaB.Bin104]|nr:MAG: Riboflavin synthase [Pelotomaculum sp. PtaB.Bin104]
MFTGIIEELGVLRGTRQGADSAQLVIGAEKVLKDVQVGDSIAVNGVCLTVIHFTPRDFTADVMAETLAKTNLEKLTPGNPVNLERALRLGDRLGGHLVSGHVDGTGTIIRMEKHDIATLVSIRAPREVMRYIIKKGSVAIDGISLTVVDFQADNFQVSLIPHTAHATTLGLKRVGDNVNLEGDVIGKYIERLFPNSNNYGKESKISLKFLSEHGFV